MHFPIIELSTVKLEPVDWMDDSVLWDDALIESHTDYIQSITRRERDGWLRWLPSFFEDIADVDLEKDEIRFKSEEEINKTLDDYYREIVGKMQNTDYKGWRRFFEIRRFGECYKDADALFYVNNCSMTSMQFIEDCNHYAGQTLYIGGVVDAHV